MADIKTIARNISRIENRTDGYEKLLLQLDEPASAPGIIGITGAPGAGKSTIVDGLIQQIINRNKTVAVLCIDPSSPFNMGALLGDRVRMNKWYTHKNVFIRSMASRKALGGLSPMIIEVSDYIKNTGFDFIIIETVGVGQSEIEIAGLADVTVVILVPESGDEIQTMKSGVMEIAGIFVVNKCDRPGADHFVKHLNSMLAPVYNRTRQQIPVIKTIAENEDGLNELFFAVETLLKERSVPDNKYWLLAERAYQLIQAAKMANISKEVLFNRIKEQSANIKTFNLYRFIKQMLDKDYAKHES
ncbi:MAG TPA: methylmalonyl Co-A mutase-associated GTPase MeaB [Panacibacter sp.]|nr:methylmalonyl Co-A mutase-associated GTPase MeaB [Panacibacter sp.]